MARQHPAIELPDGAIRITAAHINDAKSPERETVTLLNTADVAVELSDWQIKEKLKITMAPSGKIEAGAPFVGPVVAPVALSNDRGIVTLLAAEGLKVDGSCKPRNR